MRVIFLDIDGVLNSEEFFVRKHEEKGAEAVNEEMRTHWPLSEICPKLVSNLNKLVEQTDAKIVVSSTWRHGRSIEELQSILDGVGFKGEVVDKTPDLNRKLNRDVDRGEEIEDWLVSNRGVKSFVILDDDGDMLDEQLDCFVHTSFKTGLNEECTEKAIQILKNV